MRVYVLHFAQTLEETSQDVNKKTAVQLYLVVLKDLHERFQALVGILELQDGSELKCTASQASPWPSLGSAKTYLAATRAKLYQPSQLEVDILESLHYMSPSGLHGALVRRQPTTR